MKTQVNLSRVTIKTLIVVTIVALSMMCCLIKANAAEGEYGFTQLAKGNTETSVSLKWEPIEGIESYELRYNGNSVTTAENEFVLENLPRNKSVRVTLYKLDSEGNATYCESIYVKTIPTMITGFKLKTFDTSNISALFTWNKKSYVDGYQFVAYTRDGKSKVVDRTIKGPYPNIRIDKKLKANTFYKVKVRAYVEIEGKKVYGPYTKSRQIAGGPKKLNYNKYEDRLSFMWSEVSGATFYNIYISTAKPKSSYDNMTKVKSVKSNKTRLRDISGKKYNKKNTYYIRIVAIRKIGETYYRSIAGYFVAR